MSELDEIEPNPAATSNIYKEAFRRNCFRLIHAGYKKLDCSALHGADEPEVTGEMVRVIQDIMDLPGGAEWHSQIAVKDNPPLNMPGMYGKRRPLVDFEFEFTGSRPRSRYRIEAKWVGKSKTPLGAAKGYLGNEGIGCFLSGKYPADNHQAGMLAYVHSEDEATWAKNIHANIEKKRQALAIRNPVWTRDAHQEPFHAYISEHNAPAGSTVPLQITHLLLRFT